MQLASSAHAAAGSQNVAAIYAFTTNSILRTLVAEYRLIVATYRGASAINSRCHPLSATSTRRMPSAKLTARVRSATALPQATGHASSALSSAGAPRRDFATIDSKPSEARFNVTPEKKFSNDRRKIRKD
jgi:hypothetical protein